jgi:transcriptional regulator with AAA-type ATPase domain
VAGSPADAYKEIDRAIQSAFNVILEGESGVGKDYFARLIHQRRNWGGEFVVYDCEQTVRDQTRIVEQLTSPVFFQKLRRSTEKDTVFIRRIDLLQAHLFARLSDFLGELGKKGAFPRNKLLSSGIIGSLQTSRHKKSLINIQLHRFLNTLFCVKIRVLPLRERKKEIPSLVKRFISLFNKEQKKNVLGITPDALALLLQYNWPNNICELRAEIERAATLTKNYESIKPSALSENLIKSVSKTRSLY